jgi:hypothetical protein
MLNAPEDITECRPRGGLCLPPVPLRDAAGSQAVGQWAVRGQRRHWSYRAAVGHVVWAAGQLQVPQDTDQGVTGRRRWEWTGGGIEHPELSAEGVSDFPGQQGHQAPVQACITPCEAGGRGGTESGSL